MCKRQSENISINFVSVKTNVYCLVCSVCSTSSRNTINFFFRFWNSLMRKFLGVKLASVVSAIISSNSYWFFVQTIMFVYLPDFRLATAGKFHYHRSPELENGARLYLYGHVSRSAIQRNSIYVRGRILLRENRSATNSRPWSRKSEWRRHYDHSIVSRGCHLNRDRFGGNCWRLLLETE